MWDVLDVTEGQCQVNISLPVLKTAAVKEEDHHGCHSSKEQSELTPVQLALTRRPLIKFCLHPTTTLVSYIPKKNKNVVLLSTLHTAADISDRGNRKPVIILDYSHNEGGMDNLNDWNIQLQEIDCAPAPGHHDIINLSSMTWCYRLRSTLPDVQ